MKVSKLSSLEQASQLAAHGLAIVDGEIYADAQLRPARRGCQMKPYRVWETPLDYTDPLDDHLFHDCLEPVDPELLQPDPDPDPVDENTPQSPSKLKLPEIKSIVGFPATMHVYTAYIFFDAWFGMMLRMCSCNWRSWLDYCSVTLRNVYLWSLIIGKLKMCHGSGRHIHLIRVLPTRAERELKGGADLVNQRSGLTRKTYFWLPSHCSTCMPMVISH